MRTRRLPDRGRWVAPALAAALACGGLAARAEAVGHELPCEACHVPHLAKSEHLWPYELPDVKGGWYDRTVAKMCYVCHSAGNPYGGSNQSLNAYGNAGGAVHLYDVSRLPRALDGSAWSLGKDVALRKDGAMDCTTCHEPHSRTRPSYRFASAEESCRACHGRAGSGLRAANTDPTWKRSTHPVDVPYDFQASRTGGEPFPSSYAFSDIAGAPHVRNLGEPLPGEKAPWDLGARLVDGRIGCGTCHAVHGGEDYEVAAGDGSRGPFEALLAVPMLGRAAGASPDSDARAALCQACHRGGDPGESVRTLVLPSRSGGATAPAAGSGSPPLRDHPTGFRRGGRAIDEHRDAAAADASAGEDGGRGWSAYWGPRGELTCVTCHDVHGGMAGTSLYRLADQTALGQAQTAETYCDTCHADVAPLAHHSNKANYVDSLITCSDCHGATGTDGFAAHGTFLQAFAAPAADQTRSLPSAVGTPEVVTVKREDIAANRDSALCVYCHSPADPLAFELDNAPVSGASLAEPKFPASHGARRGKASHQVLRGDNDSIGQQGAKYQGGSQPGAGIFYVGKFVTEYYARYGVSGTEGGTGGGTVEPVLKGGGADLLICESCHNVRWNVGTWWAVKGTNPSGYPDAETGYRTNLLLEPYEDDTSVNGLATEVPDLDKKPTDSTLCARCHPFSVAKGLVHLHGEPDGYLDWGRGLEAGSADLTGWSQATLETAGLQYAPLRPDFPSRLSWRPDAPDWTKLDCDACHRPHSASDLSTMKDNLTGQAAPLITEFAGPADALPGSPTFGNPAMRREMCDACHTPKSL